MKGARFQKFGNFGNPATIASAKYFAYVIAGSIGFQWVAVLPFQMYRTHKHKEK